ncbi:TspO/MBR family protein [Ferruginibacter sp. HRS2-29]|uniref:TspO/MBR family protein n=1 Tax=Ferruginibacter sp. HRS2-29 TaxID=2487334 RepID=UPI0020CC66F8|nr:TspO/MBR family protein [Ferruginibacter sp. HRS2-29]MCP9749411.1 tryptophan-rich sensory protein [Ferruginibacter sp. HRS2-29]
MKPIFKLIISIAIPLAVGAVSGYLTMESVQTWYTTLNKPSFNPPNGIFAPVWTTLYIMMGIACFLVWKKDFPQPAKRRALIFYSIQLLLNFLWSFIFFYLHEKGAALAEIILLWIFILLTIISFGKISKPAAWLLVPYILWVSFATVLTYSIWNLN